MLSTRCHATVVEPLVSQRRVERLDPTLGQLRQQVNPIFKTQQLEYNFKRFWYVLASQFAHCMETCEGLRFRGTLMILTGNLRGRNTLPGSRGGSTVSWEFPTQPHQWETFASCVQRNRAGQASTGMPPIFARRAHKTWVKYGGLFLIIPALTSVRTVYTWTYLLQT